MRTPLAQDIARFVDSIANAGFVNSLAQTLIKIAAPGVPDFYQGVEFWDFNLVDPDNRRPVDFESRRQALATLSARAEEDLPRLAADLLARWPDESLKLFVIHRALQFRGASGALLEGDYQPLAVEGPRKAHVCAFLRVRGNAWAICIVPRLAQAAWQAHAEAQAPAQPAGAAWPLAEWWRDSLVQLPPGAPARFRHVLSGDSIEVGTADGFAVLDVGDVLRSFPVALLAGEPNS